MAGYLESSPLTGLWFCRVFGIILEHTLSHVFDFVVFWVFRSWRSCFGFCEMCLSWSREIGWTMVWFDFLLFQLVSQRVDIDVRMCSIIFYGIEILGLKGIDAAIFSCLIICRNRFSFYFVFAEASKPLAFWHFL